MQRAIANVWMAVMLSLVALATAQADDASRLPGLWAVDVAQLPMPPEARPKRVTVAFDDTGAGPWMVRVEIVPAQGEPRISTATLALDGSTVAIAGDTLEADAVAMTRPTRDVLVMVLAKNGGPASTRVYTVAPDGDHLVETATHYDADGRPVIRTFRFERVR
ncbi:MAG: hypothetical protein ABW163_11970 [Luteimonas sp.]